LQNIPELPFIKLQSLILKGLTSPAEASTVLVR
jgi:hypothetical protein